MQAWFGRISLYWQDNARGKLTAYAAVYCLNREEFEALFQAHISAHGYHIAEFDIVVTANEWLRTYGYTNDVLELTGAVNECQRVATSKIVVPASVTHEASVDYLSISEHRIPSLTNDNDLAIWEKAWITPELKQLLFSQSGEESLNTYLIVDAYLRKKISGIFDLEDDFWDIPIKCLFKGQSADKLKEVSPYLIDMTLSEQALIDDEKVPKFHKDFFVNHWDKQTGIFIRTTANMDEVWAHFRRFTRVQMEEDKMWVYFRFWQPHVAQAYFTGLATLPEKIVTWGRISEKKQITQWITETNNETTWDIQPIWTNLSDYPFSKKALLISEKETQPLEQQKVEQFDEKVARELCEIYSDLGKNVAQFKVLVQSVRKKAQEFGIQVERDIVILTHLGLILGHRFLEDIRFSGEDYMTDTSLDPSYRVERFADSIEEWFSDFWGGEQGELSQILFSSINQPIEQYKLRHIKQFISMINPKFLDFEKSLSKFIDSCYETCKGYDITTDYAVSIYILIALVYGQWFISDPMYVELKETFEVASDNDDLKARFCFIFEGG